MGRICRRGECKVQPTHPIQLFPGCLPVVCGFHIFFDTGGLYYDVGGYVGVFMLICDLVSDLRCCSESGRWSRRGRLVALGCATIRTTGER